MMITFAAELKSLSAAVLNEACAAQQRQQQQAEKRANPTKQKILTFLAQHGEASIVTISTYIGVHKGTVHYHVSELMQAEKLVSRKEDRKRVYFLKGSK